MVGVFVVAVSYLWSREGLIVPKMLAEQPAHKKENTARGEPTKRLEKMRARRPQEGAQETATPDLHAMHLQPSGCTGGRTRQERRTSRRCRRERDNHRRFGLTCCRRRVVDDSLVHADGPLKLHVASRYALHLLADSRLKRGRSTTHGVPYDDRKDDTTTDRNISSHLRFLRRSSLQAWQLRFEAETESTAKSRPFRKPGASHQVGGISFTVGVDKTTPVVPTAGS